MGKSSCYLQLSSMRPLSCFCICRRSVSATNYRDLLEGSALAEVRAMATTPVGGQEMGSVVVGLRGSCLKDLGIYSSWDAYSGSAVVELRIIRDEIELAGSGAPTASGAATAAATAGKPAARRGSTFGRAGPCGGDPAVPADLIVTASESGLLRIWVSNPLA
jgi:hypothetical protein